MGMSEEVQTTGMATATVDGMEISSSDSTPEQIVKDIESAKPVAEPEEPIDTSKAAAALGKLGGDAAAAKRIADRKAEASAAKAALESEEGEGEETADATKTATGQTPAKRSARERVLQATRAAKEAREETAQARADAAQARAEREWIRKELEAARNPKPAAESKIDPDAPKAEDFEEYDRYIDALTQHRVNKALAERDAKEHAERGANAYDAEVDELLSDSASAQREFISARPTFLEEVSAEILGMRPSMSLDANEMLGPDNVIADEIILSKSAGPLIELYLTDHPEELERLRALRSPQQLQVEMRILAKTVGAASPGPKPVAAVSKAKPPVKPVIGSPHIAEEDLTEEMSLDEYVRKANARERARR